MIETVISGLKQGKHRLFRATRPARMVYYDLTEPLTQAWHRRFPYRYRGDDFAALPFMAHNEPARTPTTERVPRRIFTFWGGSNPMSDDRQAGLDSLRRLNPDLEVLLITPDNRSDWILPEAPLHPAFGWLHHVHQADYLRCYFLHFHGGGYADIKPFRQSWTPAFDEFDASDAWLMGHVNPRRWMTPNFSDPGLQKLMRRTSVQRLCQSAYLARARTPITAEWWLELNRVMDDASSALAEHPGDERGSDPKYPLAWNRILAQILDPLTVKYSDRLLRSRVLLPDLGAPYL